MDESVDSADEARTVQAIAKFSFDGKNNDELSFNKNDMITITQQMDGGWWEGTIDGRTGWFPSDYVNVIKEKDKLMRCRSVPNATIINGSSQVTPTALADSFGMNSTRNQFRAEVMTDFILNEEKYLTSLRRTYTSFLQPIKIFKVLSDADFNTLTGNIDVILPVQENIFKEIKRNASLNPDQQRIGRVLIEEAATLKDLFLAYCSNHPKAVEVLHEQMSIIKTAMESVNGDISMLISGLSEPFRHLDKYPIVLQELERNMPEGHIDRGDIQRSCAVYKDIKSLCEAARKQKEMQLELLYTGQVEGWASFEERGKIIFVGTGTMKEANDETHDRCLALFSKMLLVLEITPQLNSYKLVSKLASNKLRVKRSEERNVISFADLFLLTLSSSFEADRWMEALAECEGIQLDESATILIRPTTPQKFSINNVNSVSLAKKAEINNLPVSARARVGKKPSFGPSDLRFNHELEMILPESEFLDDHTAVAANANTGINKPGFFVKSVPPHRSHLSTFDTTKKGIKMRKDVSLADQDDALLLRIVEGYCSGAARAGIHPVVELQPPQLIVAEDEKILVEEVVGDELVLQEKSLVDTVYALKDQVAGLRAEIAALTKTVEKEQRARRRLEDNIRRNSHPLGLSASSTPKPSSEVAVPLL